eukprot:13999325-Alexandrium_andersonii.AAC.1
MWKPRPRSRAPLALAPPPLAERKRESRTGGRCFRFWPWRGNQGWPAGESAREWGSGPWWSWGNWRSDQ